MTKKGRGGADKAKGLIELSCKQRNERTAINWLVGLADDRQRISVLPKKPRGAARRWTGAIRNYTSNLLVNDADQTPKVCQSADLGGQRNLSPLDGLFPRQIFNFHSPHACNPRVQFASPAAGMHIGMRSVTDFFQIPICGNEHAHFGILGLQQEANEKLLDFFNQSTAWSCVSMSIGSVKVSGSGLLWKHLQWSRWTLTA